MPPNLSVLLIHRDLRELVELRTAFEALEGIQLVGERTDLRSGMAMAHQLRPNILVLELSDPGDDILAAAAQYRVDHSEGAIFACTDLFNPDILVRAMRAGVQEVLRRPLDRSALTAAVERVGAIITRKQGGRRSRSVISVFAGKGGVGATTLATNLAFSMRRQTGRETSIADFDNQSGDVATLMGVSPSRTLADVLVAERIDSASVQDAMTRHHSGVAVLAQPDVMDRVGELSPQQAGAVLEVLAGTYEGVVVDAPHLFNDLALEIFDRSTMVLLVTELNVPSVRASRRALDVFQKFNYLVTPDRVRLVVNRRSETSAILPVQVEDTLGLPISFNVANDYVAVSQSINLGRPLCADQPASRAGRDIDAIVRDLFELEAPARARAQETAPRKGLVSFLRKGLRNHELSPETRS